MLALLGGATIVVVSRLRVKVVTSRASAFSFTVCTLPLNISTNIIRKILHKTKTRKKANWIGHILLRNCLLTHIVDGKKEGKIEVTGREGRRCRQLLDDLKEKRKYYKLILDAL